MKYFLLQNGIEPKFFREFVRLMDLNLTWFDAKYNWGTFNEATQRWVGVIGHTLYGDIDVGMPNIDMVHARYQVIDYSHYMR